MHLRLLPFLVLGVRLLATPASEMGSSAGAFLSSLTADQKAKASFAFDAAERENWHFIPRDRNGLPLKEMTPAQRHLAN